MVDLGDTCRRAPAYGLIVGAALVGHSMLGVVVHRDHFFSAQSQKDVEHLAVSRYQFRFFDFIEIVGMVVIVLYPGEHVIEARAGNERAAVPMMNESFGDSDLTAFLVQSLHLLDEDLP